MRGFRGFFKFGADKNNVLKNRSFIFPRWFNGCHSGAGRSGPIKLQFLKYEKRFSFYFRKLLNCLLPRKVKRPAPAFHHPRPALRSAAGPGCAGVTTRLKKSFIFRVFVLACFFVGANNYLPLQWLGLETGAAHAGQAANVDYVHKYIAQKWGITVPIKATNIYQVVNVKYVLCAIDRGNEILNGAPPATTYCNHALATNQVIDTFAVNDAVNRLIGCRAGYHFAVNTCVADITCPAGQYVNSGSCAICPKDYYCSGDGDKIACGTVGTGYVTNCPGAPTSLLCHATPLFAGTGGEGEPFKIYLTIDVNYNGAMSTGNFQKYGAMQITAAGNFAINWGDGSPVVNITKGVTDSIGNMSASLYQHTYSSNGNYTVTLTGKATAYSTAYYSGNIRFPAFMITVFGAQALSHSTTGVSGDIASVFPVLGDQPNQIPSFYNAFGGLQNFTGPIPSNLFAGLHACNFIDAMFASTFSSSKVSGTVPSDLFANISGAPTADMFNSTFAYCPGLTSIGDGLFNGIIGPLQNNTFKQMFYLSTGLTGPSAKSGGQFLYEKWPSATTAQVGMCYTNATGLSDYATILAAWK